MLRMILSSAGKQTRLTARCVDDRIDVSDRCERVAGGR